MNQSWSGQITLPELRKSDFLQVVQLLETEDDINQVTQYFSYEHFYVIYCKFWELDRDHDLFIDKNDLARHSDHGKGFLVKFYVVLFDYFKLTDGINDGITFLSVADVTSNL